MKVVATLSAYNEAKNIQPVIARIRDLGYGCIVIDDGSRDGTAQIAEEAGAVVVRHPINLGQGYAVLTGLKAGIRHPGCEIILEMDADGQRRPEEISRFVDKMEQTQADIVVGSRTLGQHGSDAPFLRRTMLPYVTWSVNTLSGYSLSDSMCGFRAFRTSSLVKVLPLLDHMLEPQYLAAEMFIRFGRAGLVVEEVPVHVDQRASGVSTKGMLRYGTGILKAMLRTVIEAKPRV